MVKRYSFFHHSPSTGLASNEVIRVVQDESGFIWIGTNNGLQRYDGTRYLTFRSARDKNDQTSIPNNIITQLLFDKKNNLWLMTGDGSVGIFDTRHFIFHPARIKVSNAIFLQQNKKLVLDEEGNLMIVFANFGFITLNEKKHEFSAEYNFIPLSDEWHVVDIIHQPGTKKYWIGTYNGIVIYNRRTNQLSYSGHNAENENFIDKFGHLSNASSFLFTHSGQVWFTSWGSGSPFVHAYDINKNEVVLDHYNLIASLKKYHEIGGFLEQKNGTIWVRGLGVFGKYLE